VEIDAPAVAGTTSITVPATSGEIVVTDSSGNVNIDSGTLYVDAGNNRVGIGTTDPGSYSFSDLVVNGATGGMSIVTGTSDTGSLVFADGVAGVGAFRGAVQYDHSVDSLVLAANGAEKARIDSSGRLLVGTSSSLSANRTFQVAGTGGEFLSSSDFPADLVPLIISRSRGSIGSPTVVSSGDGIGALTYKAYDGSSYIDAATIKAEVDGTPGSNDMPGRLVFSTTSDGSSSPTERFRLQANGVIGTGSLYNRTTAAAANVYVDSGTDLYRSTSSIKYKTDVETIQDDYADAILNVRPVWYRSTCEGDCSEHSWWGFIAEEVAEIDPRLVHWKTKEITYDENGCIVPVSCDPEPEGVAYERFVPHLLNLIKRQKEQIETLEQRLNDAGIA